MDKKSTGSNKSGEKSACKVNKCLILACRFLKIAKP